METEVRPRRTRWRVVAAAGTCIVVATGLIAYRFRRDSQPSPSDLVHLAGKIAYPAGSEVCSGPMTPGCAHQAAVRAGHAIEWLPSPTGFTTDGVHLLAVKGRNGVNVFTEELHSKSALADLQVGQIGNDVGAPDGTAQVGGATATISHRFDFGAAGGGMFDYYASWLVEGRPTRLSVSSDKIWGGTQQSTRRILTDLLGALQVASLVA